MDRQILKDKVIILIGASGGLGKVFAEEFAAEGAVVVMTGRNKAKLKEAAKEIEAKGGEVFPLVADFKKKEDAPRVCQTVLEKYGKFDALVTNASRTGDCVSIEVCDDDYIDDIIDTDVKGLLRYNREAMKHFLERDDGIILNIGSNNIGRPICDAVYCAAKYAEWGLTRQMAMRCVGTGVRCNLLNPGSFPSNTSVDVASGASHMYDAGEKVQASGILPVVNGSMVDIMKARTNRAVPVDLKQVAYAAIYLISDLAKNVNGQMFTVDRGGYM
ncbi:MAG: SDR family oxidoreductase [Hespellia sp.]|nr:SDR family oxidoreductase [Hespellia sp.]